MKRGLQGQFLPESWEDFEELKTTVYALYDHCVHCKEDFFPSNVLTKAGWVETQLSGSCEKCWDTLFADLEEDHV